jgi:hypothetical protein
MKYGINEIVPETIINQMVDFIKTKGYDMFISLVYCGSFEEVAFAYIHPHDDMRNTKEFKKIQYAFINAYV